MYGLLDGLTIVEGAAFIAAPSCGLHFAQLGARVIRFDQIGGGPDSRRWPLASNGASLYWEGLNKGKKSIAIDLSRTEGRELAQRIATAGDGLFITNFPERGFLSYDKLTMRREDLICLRVMGWPDGRNAVDYTINAATGLPWLTGHPDDERPVNHVLPAWDLLAGTYGAFALLAAERSRRLNGAGREVRLALSDLAAAMLGHLGFVSEAAAGGTRERTGNSLYGAFGRDFTTADGVRLMIVAITPRQWRNLVEILGVGPDVAEQEARLGVSFATDEGLRFIHREVLEPIISAAISKRSLQSLQEPFDAHDVCWARYNHLPDALKTDRLFADNPVFSTVTHPGGTYITPGAPVRLSDAERDLPSPAPRLGQHTDEMLSELLALSSGEIARLHDAGLVA